MQMEYGMLFSERINTDAKLAAFVNKWNSVLQGRSHNAVAKTVQDCIKAHAVPFTTKHFLDAYSANTSAAHKTHKALPRPKPTEEQRAIGFRALKEMKDLCQQ